MCYKKMLVVILPFICIACIAMIYNVNRVYPMPKDIFYTEGETAVYKGLDISIGEIELYQNEQVQTVYPEIYSGFDSSGKDTDTNIIIANIKIKNTTDRKISLRKEGIVTWPVEAAYVGNDVDLSCFMMLNPEYTGSFEAGAELEVKLVYPIADRYLSWEKLNNSDIKVIYSYYPTKNYILYEAKRR